MHQLKRLLIAAAMASVSHAAVLDGTLDFVGNLEIVGSSTTFQGVNFFGAQEVVVTNNDLLASGTIGSIKDLTNLPGQQPVNSAFLYPGFVTVGGIDFTLTFIEPGIYSAAGCFPPATALPGTVCTPPSSPLNLVNNIIGGTASFSVRGTATDGSSSPASAFTGTFTVPFPARNIQDLFTAIDMVGAFNASYAATLVVSAPPEIPEPGTASLAVIAGVLFASGGLLRRKLMS